MTILQQFRILLMFSLKSLGNQFWPAINAIIGIAAVVGTVATILAIAAGYRGAMNLNGSSENVLIMSSNAKSELESHLEHDVYRQVQSQKIAATNQAGTVLAAAESYSIVIVEQDQNTNNIALRGVEAVSYQLRENWQLVSGRLPKEGHREVIVGSKLMKRFPRLNVGKSLQIENSDWRIVGEFSTQGSVAESEIWGDRISVQTLQNKGPEFQVIYMKPPEDSRDSLSLSRIENLLNESAKVTVEVQSEANYYSKQSEEMTGFVEILAFGISFLMATAAMFAAMNASHASIAARSKEFATFMVLGADQRTVTLSILFESIVIGVLGALLGFSVAFAIYDGYTASTFFHSQNFTQVVFDFDLNLEVFVISLSIAVVTSLLGGLWPAMTNNRESLSVTLGKRG